MFPLQYDRPMSWRTKTVFVVVRSVFEEICFRCSMICLVVGEILSFMYNMT